MSNGKTISENKPIEGDVLSPAGKTKRKANASVSTNAIVAKSNELIQKTRYSLPKVQQKVLFAIISKIDPKNDTEPSKVYTLSFQEFSKLTGVDTTNATYVNYLKETIKDLADSSFWIQNRGEKKETLMRWIGDGTTVDYENKEIRLRFSDSIFPHLTQLQSRFTRIEVRYVLRMNSTYSMRIYEILCSYDYGDKTYENALDAAFSPIGENLLDKFYETTGQNFAGYKYKLFDIEDLKEQLSPAVDNSKKVSKKDRPLKEKYKNFANFEANVLRIARDEINELTDMWLEYIPSKSKGSRKYDLVYFLIKPKTGEEMKKVEKIYAEAQAANDIPRKASKRKQKTAQEEQAAANTPLGEEIYTFNVAKATRALGIRAEIEEIKKNLEDTASVQGANEELCKATEEVLRYLGKVVTNLHDDKKAERARETVDGINTMIAHEGDFKAWTVGMAQTLLTMESAGKLKTPQYNAAVVANAVNERQIISLGKQKLSKKPDKFNSDWNSVFDEDDSSPAGKF